MPGLYLNKPYQLEWKTVPSVESSCLGSNDVRIKVELGGICGSDLKAYKGELGYVSYPVRMGHELVGRVIDCGADVSLKRGERVVVQPNLSCGQCEYCINKKRNLCKNKRSMGINIDGGFSTEILLPAENVYPIKEGIPDPQSILIEPLAVVVHAFEKVEVGPSTSVAIVGCGTEGLLAAVFAYYKQASVTALDINPKKLDIAKQLGSISVSNGNEVEKGAFDVVVECSGTASGLEKSFSLVKPGGSLVILGITEAPLSFPAVDVVRNEISIFGSIIYNCPGDFMKAMDYLGDPEFYVSPIISGIYDYRDYQIAFHKALSGNYAKLLLNFKEAK